VLRRYVSTSYTFSYAFCDVDVALLVMDNTAQVIVKMSVYVDMVVLGELFQDFI